MQVQWTLLDGVNDGADEIDGLVRLLAGRHAVLNLIPYNAVDGLALARPAAERSLRDGARAAPARRPHQAAPVGRAGRGGRLRAAARAARARRPASDRDRRGLSHAGPSGALRRARAAVCKGRAFLLPPSHAALALPPSECSNVHSRSKVHRKNTLQRVDRMTTRRVLLGQLIVLLASSTTCLAQMRRVRVGWLALGPLQKAGVRTLSETLLLSALRQKGWSEPDNLVLESRGPASDKTLAARRQSWFRSGLTSSCRPALRRSRPCAI